VLGLVMIDVYAKFEVSLLTHSSNAIYNAKCIGLKCDLGV